MNWKIKCKVQNLVAGLPPSYSNAAYYWLQRQFGGLRRVNPVNQLRAGIAVCKWIEGVGRSPVGATFLEVGTGRRISTPIAFWLFGAERIITVDLNRYLKEELVKEDLAYMRENRAEIEDLFNGRIHDDRLSSLVSTTQGRGRLGDVMDLCGIEYMAPADATKLSLPSASIDFHASYTVLEHIPESGVKGILEEASRVLKDDGLLVHRIDYSDHFSHSDKSISPINFLQYDNVTWQKIAGNRYMYMNRLRVDDFEDLFESSGQKILRIESDENQAVRELLENGSIRVDKSFSGKSAVVLSITGSWIVSQRRA